MNSSRVSWSLRLQNFFPQGRFQTFWSIVGPGTVVLTLCSAIVADVAAQPADAAATDQPEALSQFVDDPSVTVFGVFEGPEDDTAPIDILGNAIAGAAERGLPADIPPVVPTGPDNPFLPVPIPETIIVEGGENSVLTFPGAFGDRALTPPLGSDTPRGLGGLGIVTTELGLLDSGGVGVVGRNRSAIGQDIFSGMTHGEAARLISNLPVSRDSSVLHKLRRAILLTGAVPRGEASGANLLAIRLDRLAAQGDVMAMMSLADAAGRSTESEDVATLWANAFLAAGNNALACSLADQFVGSSDEPYWFKLLAFCQVLAGKPEVARLGAELLIEQGVVDPAYYALLDLIGGNELREVTSLAEPTPLHLAMIQAANLTIPVDAFSSPDNVVQFALARAPNSDLMARLHSILDGERRGVFERNKVAEIYAAVPFAPQELIAYDQRGAMPDASLKMPFLFQMAMSAASDSRRAQILSELWPSPGYQDAENGTTYTIDTYGISLASLPAVRMIAPNADLARYAAGIVRALVLGGDYDRALAWFEELAAASAIISLEENPHISAASLELWPILQFVAAAGPDARTSYYWPREQAEIWGQELLNGADESRRRWMSQFFSMAESLGRPVDEGLLRRFMDSPYADAGSTPPYHIWRGLGRAAAERRVGEVAILSLIALGEDGVRKAHPAIVATVLSSLVAVGLEREANQLAAEILIARGP